MKEIKQAIVYQLSGSLKDVLTTDEIGDKLVKPNNPDLGNLSFPCQSLARHYRKSPKLIAEDLAESLIERGIGDIGSISSVEPLNGFINFKYDDKYMATDVLTEVLSKREDYGKNYSGQGKVAVFDLSSPNSGKPMHFGHIRSTIVGDSIINLFKFSGYNTHGINYLGDIGLHMGKLIVAYNRWGDGSKLKENPEKEMFNLYVKFGKESKKDPELETEAKEMLRKIEKGDEAAVDLLDKVRGWSMDSFNRVYNLLDVQFDEITGQSHFTEKGKKIAEECLERRIAKHVKLDESQRAEIEEYDSQGGVVVDLSEYGLKSKVILTSDGRAIYSTQDLGAAVDRYEKHEFGKMIYVVGNDQNLYFQQLFKILEKLGYGWAKDCYHLGFGMINLAKEDGGGAVKMSSREGTVVFLEDILNKAVGLAEHKIEEKEMVPELKSQVANQVGIGAIKYMVLQVNPLKEIIFSWEKALDFNGKSAPYIQYVHARASRIIEKSPYEIDKEFNPNDLELVQEKNLIRILSEFPETVVKATENLKPNLVADYVFNLAKGFNQYYRNAKIIGSEQEKSRLSLVEATRITISNGLSLLGIKTPPRM